ncbi:MAG: hypothetical protein J6L64_03875 [Opitutales bacterium]|nr:hypothetical protein [Opitutales bacterium]
MNNEDIMESEELFGFESREYQDILNAVAEGIDDETITTAKGLRDVVARLWTQQRGRGGNGRSVEQFRRLRDDFIGNSGRLQGDGEVSDAGEYFSGNSESNENAQGIKPLEYQGTIYGYYDPAKKELHLNEEVVDLDTPIHEWTHIWWAWLKGEDPRMIERIVELMKQTKEFKTLKGQWLQDKDSVYHGMTDEEIAEEVFARFVGARREDILVREGVEPCKSHIQSVDSVWIGSPFATLVYASIHKLSFRRSKYSTHLSACRRVSNPHGKIV